MSIIYYFDFNNKRYEAFNWETIIEMRKYINSSDLILIYKAELTITTTYKNMEIIDETKKRNNSIKKGENR
jgi:hypothetical protein